MRLREADPSENLGERRNAIEDKPDGGYRSIDPTARTDLTAKIAHPRGMVWRMSLDQLTRPVLSLSLVIGEANKRLCGIEGL